MIKTFIQAFSMIAICVSTAAAGHADEKYVFSCNDSLMTASIKYSVIGRYRVGFRECQGVISYDKKEKKIRSAQLELKARSIYSNCAWCDRIVLSKRLLDAAAYPVILIDGRDFKEDRDGGWASGDIGLHGVTRDFKIRYSVEEKSRDTLVLTSKWVLPRKDFGIIWNGILDQGGILVGDHITVDCRIKAQKR